MKYTKELLEPLVNESYSYAELIRKLKLKQSGGTQYNLKQHIKRFDISVVHFTGELWSKGKTSLDDSRIKSSEFPCKRTIKLRLLKERGHKCEWCNLEVWLDKPIVLEVEHINGNNNDNQFDNLLLLCPNCHSTTPTWRRKKSPS